MPDRPAPILVEQTPRALPDDLQWSMRDAPLVCCDGASFVDELFRERRISSVEWRILRDAIWPMSPRGGPYLSATPLLALRADQPPRDPEGPSADAEIVTQLQFSRLAKVAPGRVAQWIAEGKISAAALVGKGRDARIRPAKAFADLKSHLHPGETTPESASTDR